MRTKLRIVQLSNGNYRVQVKGRGLLDLFWSSLPGGMDHQYVDDARMEMRFMVELYEPKHVISTIEERTL